MATRDDILRFCNDYLHIDSFQDFCPKGLQVIGKDEVKKIVTGVSASLELFEKAAKAKADMILVHHGEFWQDGSQIIGRMRKDRLKVLFKHDITLAGYHLPLDAHREIGNNALLVKLTGLKLSPQPFAVYEGNSVGAIGEHRGLAIEQLAERLTDKLETEALVLPFGPAKVKRVGFVSGGGAGHLRDAVKLKLDAFVTGESKESNFHLAKEAGIHVIYAGHYNTETLGIKALGELVVREFGVGVEFIDVPCPL